MTSFSVAEGARNWCAEALNSTAREISETDRIAGVTPVTSMLFDQIKNYLVETAGVDSQKFENPELKVADLNLDSLGLIEMLFEVEDKYGFQIPDPMIFLPMTFAEMVAAIDTMVQKHTASQTLKD
jgi:acyl carrier protein